jgi:ubiquinone/menaquinone biosynthesis C-methylase UbiE
VTPALLRYLRDPLLDTPLSLEDAVDRDGNVVSGWLVGSKRYPIINGIPRFVETAQQASVQSFGAQWNQFNFIDFKAHWLDHTVKNTFGSVDVFKGKVVVDAGGGSGAQSLWMLEAGAAHVIMLELSHSVDNVVQRNLGGASNFDVVQCSIDAPPLAKQSIPGIVICHNVIQHTASVEKTAEALYGIVAPGGEFVFNCYSKNDHGVLRWIRFHCIYEPLRAFLSRRSFGVIHAYATTMAALRLVPFVGIVLEKLNLCAQGDVPRVPGESGLTRLKRRFRATALNTFDGYGSHAYQHHKTDDEIRALVKKLKPSKVLNEAAYFSRPPPIGCALRLFR